MERFQVNAEEVSLCKELAGDRSQRPKEQKDNLIVCLFVSFWVFFLVCLWVFLLLVGIFNIIGRQLGKTRFPFRAEGAMQDAFMASKDCQQPLQVLAFTPLGEPPEFVTLATSKLPIGISFCAALLLFISYN